MRHTPEEFAAALGIPVDSVQCNDSALLAHIEGVTWTANGRVMSASSGSRESNNLLVIEVTLLPSLLDSVSSIVAMANALLNVGPYSTNTLREAVEPYVR